MKRSIDGEMIKGHTDMLILALLGNGTSMHGYLIRQKLCDISRQVVHPSLGRIYPLLARMEKKGWLNRLRKPCAQNLLHHGQRPGRTQSPTQKVEALLRRHQPHPQKMYMRQICHYMIYLLQPTGDNESLELPERTWADIKSGGRSGGISLGES